MKTRNSEKEHSQNYGNPYKFKPTLTDKKEPSSGMMSMFSMLTSRNWYGKKAEAPAPMPTGEFRIDSGRFTD